MAKESFREESMKTKIHAFFLCALTALFAVTASWAETRSLRSDGNGGYYINMPTTGTDNLTITADNIADGVASFKVYDDGGKDFGKGVNEVYAEGLEVGYRYYGKHQIPVRFPFGYGLSYTTFEKTEWTEEAGTWIQTIKNTGTRAGAEVAQLFPYPGAEVHPHVHEDVPQRVHCQVPQPRPEVAYPVPRLLERRYAVVPQLTTEYVIDEFAHFLLYPLEQQHGADDQECQAKQYQTHLYGYERHWNYHILLKHAGDELDERLD
jgi:hypothetical protein